jgi:hypothetical protein
MTESDVAKQALKLANRMKSMLAGRAPELVGATLAELLSTMLAGYFVYAADGKPDIIETQRLRETLLTEHIKAVRELIPVNEAIITGAPRRR